MSESQQSPDRPSGREIGLRVVGVGAKDIELPTRIKRLNILDPRPDVKIFGVTGFFADGQQNKPFVRLTEAHGRAVVDRTSRTGENIGNELVPLGVIDYKGAVMINPKVQEQISADGNISYRVYGLMDSPGFIGETAEAYISLGLPTEVPIGLYKLEEIALPDGGKISIEEWKSRELTRVRTEGSLDSTKVEAYLKTREFYILKRGLQVPERLSDLHFTDPEELRVIMSPVFDWLNTVCEKRGTGLISGIEKPRTFDIEKDADLIEYFGEWLPKQMGTYLGRLHSNKITHGYTHEQNWSAVGTLYDLDSSLGMQINGEEPSSANYKYDLDRALESLQLMVEGLPNMLRSNTLISRVYIGFLEGYFDEKYPDLGKDLSADELQERLSVIKKGELDFPILDDNIVVIEDGESRITKMWQEFVRLRFGDKVLETRLESDVLDDLEIKIVEAGVNSLDLSSYKDDNTSEVYGARTRLYQLRDMLAGKGCEINTGHPTMVLENGQEAKMKDTSPEKAMPLLVLPDVWLSEEIQNRLRSYLAELSKKIPPAYRDSRNVPYYRFGEGVYLRYSGSNDPIKVVFDVHGVKKIKNRYRKD